jgi:hypothetical protein
METQISSAEIIQDLLHIHNDRIKIYAQALQNNRHMNLDIRSIFERILEESTKYRQQLNGKISEEVNHEGNIYHAWAGVKLRQGISADNKKAILRACMDDELALLNAYSMAVSFAPPKDLKDFLANQQKELQQLHKHIRQYHDAQ